MEARKVFVFLQNQNKTVSTRGVSTMESRLYDFINIVILAWGMKFQKIWGFLAWGYEIFKNLRIFNAGGRVFKKTCYFYPGDLGLLKFWNFYPRQRIFENLETKRHLSSTVLVRFLAVNCETHLRQKFREFFIENHRF